MLRDLSDALEDLIKKGYNWTKYETLGKSGLNRAQAQGAHLEDIVKDILCGITADDAKGRESLLDKYLAFQGAANNPPDAMYRGGNLGDAFEVKKSENKSNGSLDLNSSHPYSHLTSDLSRIAQKAKDCEVWNRRDIFYVVGNVVTLEPKNNWIWFVQGNIFAADLKTFREFESDVKSSIEAAIEAYGLKPGVTNELGRINAVDPRKNTDLRIRPMWGIKSPMSLFKDLKGVSESDSDGLIIHSLMRKSKWESYLLNKPDTTKQFWANPNSKDVTISDVKVPDPDHLSKELDVKLIRIVLNLP